MISLPKYQPLQWIIIEGENAFAQIINGHEKTEGGWVYDASANGADMQHIDEDAIQAYLENGKWIKRSVVTTQSVYA